MRRVFISLCGLTELPVRRYPSVRAERAGERSQGKKDIGGRNRGGARDCNAVAVSLLDVRVESHDEMLRAARPSISGFCVNICRTYVSSV